MINYESVIHKNHSLAHSKLIKNAFSIYGMFNLNQVMALIIVTSIMSKGLKSYLTWSKTFSVLTIIDIPKNYFYSISGMEYFAIIKR